MSNSMWDRRIFIFLVILFCPLKESLLKAQVFDLIKAGVDQVNNEMKRLNEEIYQKTMIPKTIEIAGQLKKNFDESKRFYDEMKLISERPAVLSDFTRDELLRMLKENQQMVVGRAEMDYEMSYRKPGVIGRTQMRTEKYIRDNIKFADWAKEQILGNEKIVEKELTTTPDNKVDSDKQLRVHAEVQTQTLLLIAKLQAQNLEATTKLYDYLTKQERVSVDRSQLWDEEIKQLLKERIERQKKEAKTSGEVLRELLKK